MPDALKNPPKTGFWRHTESSIRTHEAQAQTWGVNFQRTIRRRNESAYWAPLPRQFDLFRVSMAGQLTGVEAPDTLTERRVAERLLASRVADGRGRGHHGPLTFDHLAAWYLDDYLVRRLRTVDTARGRVANLRATFGGQPATVMTTEAIRSYQRTRLAAGVAAATVNRETSALSRMLQLAIRAGALDHRPVFPERLEERGPCQGFFEHADYEAVRRHLPPAYQDVLDFAYYSGWRKREILELRWSEVDEGGGVVRLSPERSKTRVGRVLPIVPPIAAVLARRRAQRQGEDPVVFRRDVVTVRAWRTAWPEACRRAGVLGAASSSSSGP